MHQTWRFWVVHRQLVCQTMANHMLAHSSLGNRASARASYFSGLRMPWVFPWTYLALQVILDGIPQPAVQFHAYWSYDARSVLYPALVFFHRDAL